MIFQTGTLQSQLFHIIAALNLCGICPKIIKLHTSDSNNSVASWELMPKGHQRCRHCSISLYRHLYLYMAERFFFIPEGLLECAYKKLISPTALLVAVTALVKVGSPAETLPICGAGLGPSHLNLAGLTWNSLPVGLPQTLPLSQGRRPRCKLQQLMSATPPQNWLQTHFQVFMVSQRRKQYTFIYFFPVSTLFLYKIF